MGAGVCTVDSAGRGLWSSHALEDVAVPSILGWGLFLLAFPGYSEQFSFLPHTSQCLSLPTGLLVPKIPCSLMKLQASKSRMKVVAFGT